MCYAAGYLFQMVNPNIILLLYLNPYLILRGQVWRLFTWILIPPESFSFYALNALFFIILLAQIWSVHGECSGIIYICCLVCFYDPWKLLTVWLY